MKKRNILIAVDSIDVNTSSGAKANMALIENLCACGYEVHVIHHSMESGSRDHFTHEQIRIRKYAPLYLTGVITRLMHRHFRINLNKWIEPLFGFSAEFFSTSYAFARAIRKRGDQANLIITLSQGASFRPHYALLQCKGLHHKWLSYIHDPYPFHYYPRPYNWVQPGYRQKERFFLKMSENARWCAFPSQLLMQWMGAYFPKMEEKGILIPHQLSTIPPPSFDTSGYWNNEDFNLLHAGNLMKQRPADGLIEGFSSFLQQYPEAKTHARLHLIGPANYHIHKLENYVNRIPELILNTRGVQYHEAYNLQRRAAVNIILESLSEISPFLPGKFPHCVAAGKPVLLLSPYYSETRRLLGKEYPYWCENNDSSAIARHIGTLYEHWKANRPFVMNLQQELLHYIGPEQLKNTLNSMVN